MRGKHPCEQRTLGASPSLKVLAIGLVIVLGVGLPSPGLDLSPHAEVPAETMLAYGPSLFELGLAPLLGVLVLVELAKLAAPRFAQTVTTEAVPDGTPVPSIVGLAVLVVAAFGAVDLYRAVGETSPSGAEPLATLAGIASLVAGTVLLIWLADRIRLPGLERSGFWVVYALIAVGIVPYDLQGAVEAARAGVFPLPALGLVLLATVPAVAAIVFMRQTMARALVRSGIDPVVWSPILVWPPVVTAWIVGTVVLWAERAGFFRGPPGVWNDVAAVTAVATAVLLPAILFLYARAIALRRPAAARWRGRRVILLLLALQQTALCLAAQWFWAPQSFGTQGPEILVIVIVAHTLQLERQARPARPKTVFQAFRRRAANRAILMRPVGRKRSGQP